MTITYPLPLAAFFDAVNCWTPRFEPLVSQTITGLKGGGVIAAELAATRWSADVTLSPNYNSASVGVEAIVNSLRGSMKSFQAYDKRRAYPLADPTGSILGSSSVTISAVGSDNQSLKLAGLPAGYVLSVGDYVSVPSRKELFQILEASTANGSGVSPAFFAVTPSIINGVAAGDAVRLIKAYGFFRIVPGTWSAPASDGVMSRGGSFKAMQVFQ